MKEAFLEDGSRSCNPLHLGDLIHTSHNRNETMTKKPSSNEASQAAKEAHSPDPEKRKEAMATLREKRGKPDGDKSSPAKADKHR